MSKTARKTKNSKERRPAGSMDPSERPYELTEQECARIKAFFDRKDQKASPRIKTGERNGKIVTGVDHPKPAIGQVLLMEAVGSTDPDFYSGLIGQLLNAGSRGQKPDEHGVNFMLSVIKGIEPRDQVEAMLAAQMAAVHMATMTFARRLAHVDNISQQDSAERAFNKLARTFTTQMEALKHYRSTGQQKVTVEHVTVQAGGQAIVGSVSHSTPANDPGRRQSVPVGAIAATNEAPLPIPGGGGGCQEKLRATS
jgi:hypothetical protein